LDEMGLFFIIPYPWHPLKVVSRACVVGIVDVCTRRWASTLQVLMDVDVGFWGHRNVSPWGSLNERFAREQTAIERRRRNRRIPRLFKIVRCIV
jgi:hypothetical protein